MSRSQCSRILACESALVAALAFTPSSARADGPEIRNGINLDAVEDDLEGRGVTGWIHGSAPDLGYFVFTVRDPKNFFNAVEFSLVPDGHAVQLVLARLKRHDRVTIKGEYLDNPSPQKHILVHEVKLLEHYDAHLESDPYRRQTRLPDALLHRTELIGSVHAVAAEGRILVVEYADTIVPVYMAKGAPAHGLYRGDKVRVHYNIKRQPKAPTHLVLDQHAPRPIEVLDPISEHHGEHVTLEGELVLFPKSPEIKFDVYALRHVDHDGVVRLYTLVDLEDPRAFLAIRQKLAEGWKKHKGEVLDIRNKYQKRGLSVRARGTLNITSPAQANPQILMNGPADLDLIESGS